jgi:UDP-N-acetylmuramate--alanine ligase
MRASGHPRATHVGKRAELARVIGPTLQQGDVVITLGAGDVWQAGEDILKERKR